MRKSGLTLRGVKGGNEGENGVRSWCVIVQIAALSMEL